MVLTLGLMGVVCWLILDKRWDFGTISFRLFKGRDAKGHFFSHLRILGPFFVGSELPKHGHLPSEIGELLHHFNI